MLTVEFKFGLGDKVVVKNETEHPGFVRMCFIEGYTDSPYMAYQVERSGGSRAVYLADELRPFDAKTDGAFWEREGKTTGE